VIAFGFWLQFRAPSFNFNHFRASVPQFRRLLRFMPSPSLNKYIKTNRDTNKNCILITRASQAQETILDHFMCRLHWLLALSQFFLYWKFLPATSQSHSLHLNSKKNESPTLCCIKYPSESKRIQQHNAWGEHSTPVMIGFVGSIYMWPCGLACSCQILFNLKQMESWKEIAPTRLIRQSHACFPHVLHTSNNLLTLPPSHNFLLCHNLSLLNGH
jgi:hypothetical protein